jgi:hypothetical protein
MKNNSAVPRLTLGLPTHNGEPFLAESLDALLAQTFVKEVDSLLDQVAKETLGFPARPLPTLEKDEIAVWHGR